uniref:Uncharacterized protein n=1 Tax=Rhizophora mucronata TaxID=61149 RepID=A0A2P2R018_RHIMU
MLNFWGNPICINLFFSQFREIFNILLIFHSFNPSLDPTV